MSDTWQAPDQAAPPAYGWQQPPGTNRREAVANAVIDTLHEHGWSSGAIGGVLMNLPFETVFNPAQVTRGDQPNASGEARNAHGLYQLGGDEWNHYASWLSGRDWTDPRSQTKYLAERISRAHPRLHARMSDPAITPQEAAREFMEQYLRPSLANRHRRLAAWGMPAGGGYPGGAAGPPRIPISPP